MTTFTVEPLLTLEQPVFQRPLLLLARHPELSPLLAFVHPCLQVVQLTELDFNVNL